MPTRLEVLGIPEPTGFGVFSQHSDLTGVEPRSLVLKHSGRACPRNASWLLTPALVPFLSQTRNPASRLRLQIAAEVEAGELGSSSAKPHASSVRAEGHLSSRRPSSKLQNPIGDGDGPAHPSARALAQAGRRPSVCLCKELVPHMSHVGRDTRRRSALLFPLLPSAPWF